jgi:hypothetical protein
VGLDYFQQFWKLYPKKRKYFDLQFISGHNFLGNSHKYIDKALEEMFSNMLESDNKFFENTIINIFSDHGDHMGVPWILTYSGIVERHEPFFFQIIPSNYVKKNNRDKILKTNQDRYMSHYDIFHTTIHAMTPEKERIKFRRYVHKGYDIINQEIPLGRDYKDAG